MDKPDAARPAHSGHGTVAPRHGPSTPRTSHCLGRVYGRCTDWEHCPYCSMLEQALRAVPEGVIDF